MNGRAKLEIDTHIILEHVRLNKSVVEITEIGAVSDHNIPTGTNQVGDTFLDLLHPS